MKNTMLLTSRQEYDRKYYQAHRVEKLKRSRVHYQTHKEEYVEYRQDHKEEQAEWERSSVGKESRRKSNQKRRQENPEKIKARSILNHAVDAGKIKRSVFCEECGLPAKTHGHHKDYSKPLDVDWVCRKCHTELHKKLYLIEEQKN